MRQLLGSRFSENSSNVSPLNSGSVLIVATHPLIRYSAPRND